MYSLHGILSLNFPIITLLVLVILSIIISVLWTTIAESIIGLALDEKKEKISILKILILFQDYYLQPWKNKILPFFGLSLFLMWISSIILFWTYPLYDYQFIQLSAITTFILPIIVSYFIQIFSTFPLMTSPYLDDDLRNDLLTQGLPGALITVIWLALPLWPTRDLVFTINKIEYTSYLIILLIPLILFSLFNIIPYFIGVYNHKNYSRNCVSKRILILEHLIIHLTLPNSDLRSDLMQTDIRLLKVEIDQLVARNSTLKIYNELTSINTETFEDLHDKTERDALQFVLQNYDKLAEWDRSTYHIARLQEIYNSVQSCPNDNILSYLKISLERAEREFNQLSISKNFYIGILMSMIVAIFSFCAKYFESFALQN